MQLMRLGFGVSEGRAPNHINGIIMSPIAKTFVNSFFQRSCTVSNKGGQADSPPRCSFVANATSLTPLRPAAYHQR